MQPTLFQTTRLEAFLKFYEEQPQVYRKFRELALQLVEAGATRIGGRSIWERLRWDYLIEVQTGESPELNDHHVPYFTRLLMEREPDLFGGKFVI